MDIKLLLLALSQNDIVGNRGYLPFLYPLVMCNRKMMSIYWNFIKTVIILYEKPIKTKNLPPMQ